MKKIFQTHPSRLLLSLLFAIVGGGINAWGETSTVQSSKIASNSESWTGTAGETWSVVVSGGATNQNVTNTYAQVGTKNSPSTSITFSTSGIKGTITSVAITCASYSGLGTVSATVGGNAFGTQSQSIPSWSDNTGGTVSFSGGASGEIVITMTNGSSGRAMYVKNIVVTYEAAPSFTLTSVSNNESYGTVSVDGSTITASPKEGYRVVAGDGGYTVTEGTAEVRNNGDNTFSVTADADCTVQINFEAIPKYAVTIETPTGGTLTVKNGDVTLSSGDEVYTGTVLTIEVNPNEGYNFTKWQAIDASTHTYTANFTYTVESSVTIRATFTAKVFHDAIFSVDGNIYETVSTEEGEPIDFPANPSNKGGKTFIGWVAAPIDGVTDTAPESYITSSNMGEENVTFYAVFADVNETGEVVETKSQTLQYDTWKYSGSTTDKSSYRLFHSGSYIESDPFDLSKLSKVIVYGGTYGGGSYNSLTIGDGTNTWKDVTVSGSSQTGSNSFTEGTALSGTKPLRITSNSGTASGTGTGIRISKVEIFVSAPAIEYSAYCTTLPADDRTAVNMTDFTATTTTLVMGVTGSTTTSVTNDQPGWTAAYTYASDNTGVATVNASGVITAVARGTANITATLNVDREDASYKVGDTFSKTIKVTVVNPSHTVAFYVNGEKRSETDVEETDPIEIPEVTDYAGFVFVGWATTAIDGSQVSEPELATVSTMGESDVTYHAVYAARKVSVGEITKSYGFEESDSDDDWTIDGPVRSNKYKNSGTHSGKITTNNTYVEFKNKVKVIEFSFAFTRESGNNNYNVYIETSTDGETWSAAESYPMSGFANDGTFMTKSKTFDGSTEYYVRFHCYNTSAARYVDDVTITYEGETITDGPYYTTLTKPVSVTSVGYATYCSEANLDFEGTGITAYVGTRSGDKLTFSPITQVPANTGLLLVCAGGKTADVSVIASAPAVADNCLKGVTTAKTLEADDYILNVKVVDGEKKAGFFKAGTHTSLAANRAYIPASVVDPGVKSFALDLEDNADGIEETLSDSLLKGENIYNLAGQRLSKMQKGINIVNGKKVLK